MYSVRSEFNVCKHRNSILPRSRSCYLPRRMGNLECTWVFKTTFCRANHKSSFPSETFRESRKDQDRGKRNLRQNLTFSSKEERGLISVADVDTFAYILIVKLFLCKIPINSHSFAILSINSNHDHDCISNLRKVKRLLIDNISLYTLLRFGFWYKKYMILYERAYIGEPIGLLISPSARTFTLSGRCARVKKIRVHANVNELSPVWNTFTIAQICRQMKNLPVNVIEKSHFPSRLYLYFLVCHSR